MFPTIEKVMTDKENKGRRSAVRALRYAKDGMFTSKLIRKALEFEDLTKEGKRFREEAIGVAEYHSKKDPSLLNDIIIAYDKGRNARRRAANAILNSEVYTAETIKIKIGNAYTMDEEKSMEIKGRDLVAGQ